MRRRKVITLLAALAGALALGVGVAVVYLVAPSDDRPGPVDRLAQEAGPSAVTTERDPNGRLDGQLTDQSPTSENQEPVPPSEENTVADSTFISKKDVDVDFSEFRQLLRRDAIRPIYEPEFIPGKLTSLLIGDLVIGVEINGDSRAYPIGALISREMVNDVVGGVPILVTW